MNTTQSARVSTIKSEIAAQFGFDPQNLPVNIGEKLAAEVLGVKSTTLAVWRSTGRYNLPYLKVGRLVKYRISDLAEFLARRTASNTGEAGVQ